MHLQVSYNYYPILTMLINPFVTLHIICSTPERLPNAAYHLHRATPTPSYHLLLDAILPNLQTTTFKCFLSPTITYYLLPSCGSQKFNIPKATIWYVPLLFVLKETHKYHGKGHQHLCII
jgi:hypothetical protein